MLLTLPTTHDLPASKKVGQVCKFRRLFRARIDPTNMGEEQDVQSAKAHITGQRIVHTKHEHAKLTEESLSDTEIFMVDFLGSADTACTRTVCGEKWLDHYVSGLTQSELLKMRDIKSARPFKFGDGRVVHSTKKVKIPAMI